jgi:hypothetical protein
MLLSATCPTTAAPVSQADLRKDIARDPDPAEEHFADEQCKIWRDSLSAEDRSLFDAGRRLSEATRLSLLASMTTAEKSARGLCFATPLPSAFPRRYKETMNKRRHVHARRILMDLWDYADVLWLDLAADVFMHGMNMDFPKAFPPFKQFRNARLTDELQDALIQSTQDDIDAGHTDGFFATPPFKCGFCVPSVLVQKKDGTQRICKNYSKPEVNEITGAVAIHPQIFSHAVSAFVEAGRGCFIVVWDVEGAYPTLRIQVADQPLTQSYVPNKGYTYRIAGDFGAAVCGYRWQLFGGRLLSTLYASMAPRMRWVASRRLVAVATLPVNHNRPTQSQIRLSPALYTSLGVWGAQEQMFSVAGKLLLADRGALSSVGSTTRNTDDFFLPVRSWKEAIEVSSCIQFLHRRYQFPLKVAKFGIGREGKYDGIIFDSVLMQLSIPPEKIARGLELTSVALPGRKVSIKDVERIAGLLQWMAKVFPSIRPWLRSFYAWLKVQSEVVAGNEALSDDSRIATLSPTAARDLAFLRALLLSGVRSRSVFLRAASAGPAAVQVVIHLDWGMTPTHCCAGVSLTSGEWFIHTPSTRLVDALCPMGVANSPALEGCTVPIALFTLEQEVRGKVVLLCMDSLAFVQAATKSRSSSAPIEELLKIISSAQVVLNCFVLFDFIHTHTNLADPLTRDQIQSFRTRCGESGLRTKDSPLTSLLPPTRCCPSGSSLF